MKYIIYELREWFKSYIINTHFFHGNIWTHNWPAPNVSGFIAQLVEHRTGIARSRVQTPLNSWIFFQASLRNCINCVHFDDLFFIFISFTQFIWFISYIINTNFFHGNIWTHNWPAPNISGFISQLVEHRNWVSRGHGFKPRRSPEFFFSGFFTQLHKLRSLRRSFLHFQKMM